MVVVVVLADMVDVARWVNRASSGSGEIIMVGEC